MTFSFYHCNINVRELERSVKFYADALDSPLIEKTAQQLTGLRFDPKVLEQHLLPLCESELQHRMVQDILSLTHQQA